MFFFFQMGKNQSLPVTCEYILTAGGKKLTTTARFTRLYQQVDFCIMTEWFKMSHTFHRLSNCFLIYNAACSKFYCHTKSVPDHFFQNFNLHLSHQLCMNLSELCIPQDMKLRLFFLQLTKLLKHLMRITIVRKNNLIIQNRFQNREL